MSNYNPQGNDNNEQVPPASKRPLPLPPYKRNPSPQVPFNPPQQQQPQAPQQRSYEQPAYNPIPQANNQPSQGAYGPPQPQQPQYNQPPQQGYNAPQQPYSPQQGQPLPPQQNYNPNQGQQQWPQQQANYNPLPQQGHNGQQPQYGNNQPWNQQQAPKSHKKLIIIIAAAVAFILLIVVGLSVAIAASNNASSKVSTPASDTSGGAFDQTTFVYTQDKSIMTTMDSSKWVLSGGAWYESTGKCGVVFSPKKDGDQYFGSLKGLSEAEARQIFYEDAGKTSYGLTGPEMQATEAASDMRIDDKIITLYSTPAVDSSGKQTWMGTTLWLDEGTYFDVTMGCEQGVSAADARTLWSQALKDVSLTTY